MPASRRAANAGLNIDGKLDSYRRFTQQVQRVEFAGWRIEAVDVADDLVTLRINRNDVSDDNYLLTPRRLDSAR